MRCDISVKPKTYHILRDLPVLRLILVVLQTASMCSLWAAANSYDMHKSYTIWKRSPEVLRDDESSSRRQSVLQPVFAVFVRQNAKSFNFLMREV